MRNLVKAIAAVVLYLMPAAALAQTPVKAGQQLPSRWSMVGQWLVEAVIFGIAGVAILIGAYFVWEILTPYSVRQELVEHKNVAVALVVAAFVIGTAMIIAAAIGGP